MPINSPTARSTRPGPSRAPRVINVSDIGRSGVRRGMPANVNMPRSTPAANAIVQRSLPRVPKVGPITVIGAYQVGLRTGIQIANFIKKQTETVDDTSAYDAYDYGSYWNFPGDTIVNSNVNAYGPNWYKIGIDPPNTTGAIFKTHAGVVHVFGSNFTRTSSTHGRWFWTTALVGGVPQFYPQVEQIIEIPTYGVPAPFSTPAVQPNPFVKTDPYKQFRYRPAPGRNLSGPRVAQNFFIDIGPNGVAVGQNATTRPPRGTREVKIRSKALAAITAALNVSSELVDFLDVLFDSAGISTHDKTYLQALDELFLQGGIENIDYGKLVRGLIYNEMEDRVVGRTMGAVNKRSRKLRRDGRILVGLGAAT